ncbi:hypothetical protein BDP27DRAFT_496529 [Rhodocollybia butyracea]|uniref:Uncharacterized protein n=1 Tax=Rhodocollybia butyracea TaxID=206335 RepID=A0A9P5PYQ5_9AGAR|nr:hypothetical protein BDP27DRAFT_496529 [Rhodocollybia butyracea]
MSNMALAYAISSSYILISSFCSMKGFKSCRFDHQRFMGSSKMLNLRTSDTGAGLGLFSWSRAPAPHIYSNLDHGDHFSTSTVPSLQHRRQGMFKLYFHQNPSHSLLYSSPEIYFQCFTSFKHNQAAPVFIRDFVSDTLQVAATGFILTWLLQ